MENPPASSFAPASTLNCDYCGKAFGRTEHLKRHLLIHTKENIFPCTRCSKEFTRRDALQRHELTHQANGLNLLHTGGRACFNCRGSKARCSGGERCERCQRRCLSCVYPRNAPSQNHQAPIDSQALATIPAGTRDALEAASNPRSEPQGSFYFNSEGLGSNVVNSSAFPSTSEFDSNFWNPVLFSTINWLDPDLQEFDGFQAPLPTPSDQHRIALTGRSGHETFQIARSHGVDSIPNDFSNESALSQISPRSTQSQTDSTGLERPPPEPGEYYVDGEAARLPRVKRRKIKSHSTCQGLTPEVSQFSLRFPAPAPEKSSPSSWINEDTYSQIIKVYELLCLNCTETYTMFEVAEIPTLSCLEHLLDLYFENFNSIIPIFHMPACSDEPLHWLVCLAMLAIGSLYLESEQSEVFSHSMDEFSHRAIVSAEQGNKSGAIDNLNRIHIGMLHAIFDSYSEKSSSKRSRVQFLWNFRDSESFGAISIAPTPIEQVASRETIELEWKNWKQTESLRRTWYSAWLLDCMWVFHFEDRPVLALEDAVRPLPCHESLWTAKTSAEWYELQHKYPPTPSLIDALQKMYIAKHVPRELGEFSRQLLLHGLFRRSWEVDTYFRQRLSHWEPTAQKQASEDALPKSPIWLPSVPTFTRWRNSACDCIDILHWDTNAKIGAASGLEHPTVLHLHLSRVILLTPLREITRLAHFLAHEATATSPEQMRLDRNIIRRWASQDQFKARLAMIHAGVLFWHVRRHSANAFYEPSSVFIATLALWAFSAFLPNPCSSDVRTGNDGNHLQMSRNVSGDDMEMPTSGIILLDRPTDDELVQDFVRNGSGMWAYMSRVGNLYSKKAACRVLAVGEELLDTLTCWTIARSQLRTLARLRQAWKEVEGDL